MRPTIRRPSAAGALLLLLLGSGACVQTFDARNLGTRTTLATRATEQPEGAPFKVTKSAVFVFWGIGAASRPDLQRVLAGQVTGESQISNLRITVRSRFSDILITALTGGIIIPRTITYEGVVVNPDSSAAAAN